MSNPVDRIIQAFGGTQEALAQAAGVDQSAVSLWRRSGVIPSRRIRHLLNVAAERGISLTAADFFESPNTPNTSEAA